MPDIDHVDDHTYQEALWPIWDYLAVAEPPQQSDLIFVFGGLDLAVPARAAELFLGGYAPLILVSGNVGPFSKDAFNKPEALIFQDEMAKLGVPRESIITEEKATNALENVIFGMQVLSSKKLSISRAILISKPFMMRRAMATFQQQFPSIVVHPCPPVGEILSFCDRSRYDFAERLLAELKRLKVYSQKGDITPQHLPESVVAAAERIKTLLS